MLRTRKKAAWVAGVATAAAAALTAGLTSPTAVAQEGPTASADAQPVEQKQKTTTRTWVTLITGDRVAVDAKGRPATFQPAKGREHIPVQVKRWQGHVYAIPRDAHRLITQGALDERLFDLTTLSAPEYVASQRDGLRLIVAYRGDRPAAKRELRATEGLKLRRTLPVLNADAVTTPREHAKAAWEVLTDAPRNTTHRTAASGVATVWLDGIRKATLDKSVPQIGAPAAWQAGYDGKGVKIAVLDTGVDQTHPDLAGQQLAEKNFSESPDTKDRGGHGTHVASIAAGTGAKSGGKYRGVAPGAKILDGKVLGDDGFGDVSGIIAGLEWAAAEKADVVNLSLGAADEPGLDPLEMAVNKLSAEQGILFAISAGNGGDRPGSVGSPGSADAALTVGAVDKQDKLADFSSRGPRLGDGAIKPDVTAPGVDIGAAAAPGSDVAGEGTPVADGYVAISGTSMSAPHAAGAGAILAQQHPDWTGAQIKAALTGSATPGAYSVFEQGTGRIDLRKATTQSVIAESASLSFDKQQWPHTDDKPQSKELTYRNLGSEPLTVEVSVSGTGPEGKPAPDGFFTVKDKRLTIPAKGTATTSLSVDTRLGGTVDGAYSAQVTATAGEQSVRTAAAVEREVESYEVTFEHLDRDGEPAAAFTSTLYGLSGLATDHYVDITAETEGGKVRLPKGRYLLSSGIEAGSTGLDWINQPKLVVDKNATVTLDARTAKPVDVTVPDRKATWRQGSAEIAYSQGTAAVGLGWTQDSFTDFRTAHRGPAVPASELSQQFTSTFQRDANSPAYYVAYGGHATTAATGLVRHAKPADLAKFTATVGSPAPKKTGELAAYPVVGGINVWTPSLPSKLPRTATLYVNGKGPRWSLNFDQYNAEEEYEATYLTDELRVTPGKSYSRKFNVGVFGPKLGAPDGVFRTGNHIVGQLPLFADGLNNSGSSAYDTAETTLYRNGTKVGTHDDPLMGYEAFEVPAEAAQYKLTTSVSRSKVADVSTKITSSWTFSSKQTANQVKLPISVVRFTPSLALDSTSKAGATVKVPVSVQGSAAGGNLKSLEVYVSYDDGKHWEKLAVNSGKVSVKNPGAGKGVSFKANATDKQGNTVSQVIHNAYRTR